jgi:hypothetical protein
MRDLYPSAQQFANLGDHLCNMLVLTFREPLPVVGKPQVGADLIQGFIGQRQPFQTCLTFAMVGSPQLLTQVEGGIQ